jgi:dephospho-CoA kinase
MLKVALTGGIATGKSYCLARFARRGVPVIDADVLAHAVVRRGEPAWVAVTRRFGEDVLRSDGEIDRNRLGAIVFADAGARRDLEAIIHPAVYTAVKSWYESLSYATAFAIADIPLLYETGYEQDFDKVIATWCPVSLQMERIKRRDTLSDEEAQARVAAQLSADEKARRADYVIKTDGSFAETDRQIAEICGALQSSTDR